MRVSNIRIADRVDQPGRVRLSAEVSYDNDPTEIETYWYDFPDFLRDNISRSGNPWLVGMLPLACTLAEPLVIDASVDSVLYENAQELMDAWHFWFPTMCLVRIECNRTSAQIEQAPTKTAQFFSGGVDSLFTTVRHNVPCDPVQIDDLLFCSGFDVPLSAEDAIARLEAKLTDSAAVLGKNLVVVATNLREKRFGRLNWAELSHGCAMASVGLLLERRYKRLLVPSTDGYRETGPWGSHALTDHFFSTSSTRVVHDGAAYSRLEKVELIAKSPAAVEQLRVCWQSYSDYNCGECEKCYRTMIALDLCGALTSARSFSRARLDINRIEHIYCPREKIGSLHLYYEELLVRAREKRRDDLAVALERALNRSTRVKFLLDRVESISALPLLGRFARPVKKMLRLRLIERNSIK